MLEICHLSYALKGKYLIEDISLEFSPGFLYGIAGPNGSGKTTFLKTATGLWHPTQGKVLWQGQDLLKQNRKQISRIVSLVLPSSPIQFDYLVEEVVAMGRYAHPVSPLHQEQVIKTALTAVDGWHLRSKSINNLSTGERQRVSIARALVTESPILFLDEPTANLDIRHQLEIWELLKNLVMRGKIVISTVHDLQMAERFCDRIAVFDQGRCMGSGIYAEIITGQLLSQVFRVAESDEPLRQFHIQASK